jgi:N-acetylglucosaminyl-diphospho-decaprenol L-rhamnosyltransferase
MNEETLSIIIPTYNTASMTLACCRAALAAAADSAEVIVADDGSTDGTAGLLAREEPRVRVVRLEENRGYAVAANRGVAAAGGSILLLLNSDAVIDNNALGRLRTAFESDPKLGVAGAQLAGTDGAPQWSGGQTPTLAWIAGVVSGAGPLARLVRRRPMQSEPQREVDWVSGAAMAFRRQVWKDAGPLDERFLFYCQDLSFCLRAGAAGWRVKVIADARVVHALGGTIAGASTLRHDPERLWIDLLHWGEAYYGRTWFRFARIVLTSVAWLRIIGRRLRSPFRRDETTAALVRAARRLGSGHNDA